MVRGIIEEAARRAVVVIATNEREEVPFARQQIRLGE
jgi:hypothetical protein